MIITRGRAELDGEVAHHLKHLRLDRHVERRGRLVRDDQPRVAADGEGDHHALPHPPAELVGIVLQSSLGVGDPDQGQQIRGPLKGLAVVIPRWSFRASESWNPMVSTGLSEVIGSWKTMAMSLPRTPRI